MNAAEARAKLDKKGGSIDKQLTYVMKKLNKAIEKRKDYIEENNLTDETIDWLEKNGYIVTLMKDWEIEKIKQYKIVIP